MLARRGYTINNKLGQGAFGVVYDVWKRERDRAASRTAIKVINLENDESLRKIHIQHSLAKRLPCVLAATAFGLDDATGLFFMEIPLALGGDFDEYLIQLGRRELVGADGDIKTPDPLHRDELLSIIYNILCGLTGLHQAGLMHADLKPQNILLLEKNKHAVLADFGMSMLVDAAHRRRATVAFTAWWRPVEYFLYPQEFLPAPSGDIWAFGIILFQILAALLTKHTHIAFHPFNIQEDEEFQKIGLALADWTGVDKKEVIKIYRGEINSPDPDVLESMLLKTQKRFKDTPISMAMLKGPHAKLFEKLISMATQCLRLHPHSRPTAYELLHSFTNFIKDIQMTPEPECVVIRRKGYMNELKFTEKMSKEEQDFFDAMTNYVLYYLTRARIVFNLEDNRKHKSQLNWILVKARTFIDKWRVKPDSLDATLIRVMTVMMYWGNGNASHLWSNNNSLATFLQDSKIKERSKDKISNLHALMRALKPWIKRLEEWHSEERSNAYSMPIASEYPTEMPLTHTRLLHKSPVSRTVSAFNARNVK